MNVLSDTFDWTAQFADLDEMMALDTETLPFDRAPLEAVSHRCPGCGRLEHTDSELAGTCVFCPGFVELQPA